MKSSSRQVEWTLSSLSAVVLAAIVIFEASAFQRTTSATFDETTYLQLAADVQQRADFSRLVELGVAPLPILLAWSIPARLGSVEPPSPDIYPTQVRQARRIATLLFTVPLVLLAQLWLARRRGWFTGLIGGGLLALSPNILANGSLATTDICVTLFCLAALAALSSCLASRSVGTWAAAGGTIGLALASKYSGGLLFIVALLGVWLVPGSRTERENPSRVLTRRGLSGLALMLGGLGVAWAIHGFGLMPARAPSDLAQQYFEHFGDGPIARELFVVRAHLRIPTLLGGMLTQYNHERAGHDAFLLGARSRNGWWYYFPTAVAVKSTPVELAALGVFLTGALAWRSRDPAQRLWLIAFGVFTGIAMASRLNIGIRYVLLPLVVAMVGGVDYFAEITESHRMLRLAIGLIALVGQAASSLSIAPQYLGYFNVMAGGASQGYKLLADSNLDWGQDLPRLHDQLQRFGAADVVLAYFGTAPPAAYKISAVSWQAWRSEDTQSPQWLAVSATYLDGLYLKNDPFEALRNVPPSERVGYSIFLYSLNRPDVRQALTQAMARVSQR